MSDLCQARAEMLLESSLRRWHGHIPIHSVTYQLERLAMAHDRAGAAYIPKPYDGKVIQLYAKRQPFGLRMDPMLGWAGLFSGEFQVQEVPGFRQTMLDEPNVETLASAVTNALGACEDRGEDHEGSPETYVRTAA